MTKDVWPWKWADFNWWGRFVIRFHNVLLGPEYDLSPAEEAMIKKWGLKK